MFVWGYNIKEAGSEKIRAWFVSSKDSSAQEQWLVLKNELIDYYTCPKKITFHKDDLRIMYIDFFHFLNVSEFFNVTFVSFGWFISYGNYRPKKKKKEEIGLQDRFSCTLRVKTNSMDERPVDSTSLNIFVSETETQTVTWDTAYRERKTFSVVNGCAQLSSGRVRLQWPFLYWEDQAVSVRQPAVYHE